MKLNTAAAPVAAVVDVGRTEIAIVAVAAELVVGSAASVVVTLLDDSLLSFPTLPEDLVRRDELRGFESAIGTRDKRLK